MEIQEQTLVQIGQEQTLTVPAQVRRIAAGACGENDTLEQLTIPANHTQLCAEKEVVAQRRRTRKAHTQCHTPKRALPRGQSRRPLR